MEEAGLAERVPASLLEANYIVNVRHYAIGQILLWSFPYDSFTDILHKTCTAAIYNTDFCYQMAESVVITRPTCQLSAEVRFFSRFLSHHRMTEQICRCHRHVGGQPPSWHWGLDQGL